MGQDQVWRDTAPPSGTASIAAVELDGITKSFPGVLANDCVSFAVMGGELHCLLGENGAGKSTVVSILAGILRPDAGTIRRNGQVVHLDSPGRARALGIGMVPQQVTLVGGLTVLENLMLGESHGVLLDRGQAGVRFLELSRLLELTIPAGTLAGTLPLGQQQQVAIMKALWPRTGVLILDEPTTMLTPAGIVRLRRGLMRVKASGVAIILITHKLQEALSMADHITVLRAGRVSGALRGTALRGGAAEEVEQRVVRLMFGEEVSVPGMGVGPRQDTARSGAPNVQRGTPALQLIDVSTRDTGATAGIAGVSFAVYPGEIFGVAGVDGNGQRVLADAIAGQQDLASGDIKVQGRSIIHLNVAARYRMGVRYITDDRLGEGIVPSLSVAANLLLKRIGVAPYWRGGRTQRGPIAQTTQDLVTRFDVRTPSVSTRAGTLSGGNMQKLVLARELSFDPRVVIYHKPTQGLDVVTAGAIRDRIRAQAALGVSAVMISPDIDELLALCDRVSVITRGRVTGTVENGVDAAERIAALMVTDGAATPAQGAT